MRLSTISAALALAAIAEPAWAGDKNVEFYSATGCKELSNIAEKVGLDGVEPAKPSYRLNSTYKVLLNCTYGHTCQNDKYQSMWIGPQVAPGTTIKVWDDSKGSSRDDWAVITTKSVPTGGICVPTFEANIENGAYKLYYHRVDNLNGHISQIQLIPGPPPPPPPPAKPKLKSEKRGNLSSDQAKVVRGR